MPMWKKVVSAAAKVAKKVVASDVVKQMGSILAEKSAEAATDLLANAIVGGVSTEENIGRLQKKFIKNLSSQNLKFPKWVSNSPP